MGLRQFQKNNDPKTNMHTILSDEKRPSDEEMDDKTDCLSSISLSVVIFPKGGSDRLLLHLDHHLALFLDPDPARAAA